MGLPEVVKDWALKTVAAWPTLYRFSTEEMSILSALEHLYFTLGNGIDFHKGEPYERFPDEQEPDKILEDLKRPPQTYIPPIYCAGAHPKDINLMNADWLSGFIWVVKKYLELGEKGIYNSGELCVSLWGCKRESLNPDIFKADYYDLKNEQNPLEAYITRLERLKSEAQKLLEVMSG